MGEDYDQGFQIAENEKFNQPRNWAIRCDPLLLALCAMIEFSYPQLMNIRCALANCASYLAVRSVMVNAHGAPRADAVQTSQSTTFDLWMVGFALRHAAFFSQRRKLFFACSAHAGKAARDAGLCPPRLNIPLSYAIPNS
jgi:hypothetical protein